MKILKAITDFIFVEDEHGIKRVLGEVKNVESILVDT